MAPSTPGGFEADIDTSDPALVRDTFDRVAPSFDSILERNPINAWMHAVNMAKIQSTFQAGSRLLELGCGTGTDALALARRGCRVFALDLSPGMVARAKEKSVREGLEARTMFVQGRSRDLEELLRDCPWTPFDGAYANFTLTYEPDLRPIAKALAGVLVPGASFICTLPNRLVLSEVLLYAPLLRFPDFLWRFANPLLKDVHGSLLPIHAYSPWQVRAAFRGLFALRVLVGVPTFVPPVYLHPQYRRLGSARGALERIDAALAPRFPWNRLGEHTLYLFQRL